MGHRLCHAHFPHQLAPLTTLARKRCPTAADDAAVVVPDCVRSEVAVKLRQWARLTGCAVSVTFGCGASATVLSAPDGANTIDCAATPASRPPSSSTQTTPRAAAPTTAQDSSDARQCKRARTAQDGATSDASDCDGLPISSDADDVLLSDLWAFDASDCAVPGCGASRLLFQHGDHLDFLVDGHLHTATGECHGEWRHEDLVVAPHAHGRAVDGSRDNDASTGLSVQLAGHVDALVGGHLHGSDGVCHGVVVGGDGGGGAVCAGLSALTSDVVVIPHGDHVDFLVGSHLHDRNGECRAAVCGSGGGGGGDSSGGDGVGATGLSSS